MDNFKIIYKILKFLESSLDADIVDYDQVSHTVLRISFSRWEQLLIMMQDDGYVRGLVTSQSLDDSRRHIAEPVMPEITLKGIEYLTDNTIMRKVQREMKGIKDSIPGL